MRADRAVVGLERVSIAGVARVPQDLDAGRLASAFASNLPGSYHWMKIKK
jgi:hypothetical protein